MLKRNNHGIIATNKHIIVPSLDGTHIKCKQSPYCRPVEDRTYMACKRSQPFTAIRRVK